MTNLDNPIFHDEARARAHLEAIRWPNGPVCPHCGASENIKKLKGKSHRAGLYQCNACREHFTVTVGTVMERSHIPLRKWVMAFHLMCASKKGISAHQLHRMLGVTYKTAWFMAHRIREAMREINPRPIGGGGKVVEADETYIGGSEKNKHRNKRSAKSAGGWEKKEIALALVERGGKVRSHHIPTVSISNLRPILRAHLYQNPILVTDEAKHYRAIGRTYSEHHAVEHRAGEYVRGDVYTNTVENYFSILKRGIGGCYFHVSQQHLRRYLGEFDFRYNARSALGVEDAERTARAIKGAEGKRLTYRQPNDAAA